MRDRPQRRSSRRERSKRVVVEVNPRSQIIITGTPLKIAQLLSLLNDWYPTKRAIVIRHAMLYFALHKDVL